MAEQLRQAIIDDAPRLFAELQRVKAERDALLDLMRKFCDRVERGEIRSVRTYKEFKAAIDAARGE